jgi:ribonuclease BN (tRNA processing enzyme)
MPNVGLRLAAGEAALAYTGDCGPSPLIAELAFQADLLLAEASYVDLVPEDSRVTCRVRLRRGGGPRRPEPGACC